jgi:hypothetical protein
MRGLPQNPEAQGELIADRTALCNAMKKLLPRGCKSALLKLGITARVVGGLLLGLTATERDLG